MGIGIVFWQGTVNVSRIVNVSRTADVSQTADGSRVTDRAPPVIRDTWGDDKTVQLLFGSIDTTSAQRLHPAYLHSLSDQSILPVRADWIDARFAAPSPRPLRQQYSLRLPSQSDATARAAGEFLVTESLIALQAADSHSPPTLSLMGHIEIALLDDEPVEIACKSLHQVNNDLSIASLALDLIAIKLDREFSETLRAELVRSCASAAAAIKRAGRHANETLHRIHR